MADLPFANSNGRPLPLDGMLASCNLLAPHARWLWTVLSARLQDRQAVEECFQETMLTVVRRGETLRDDAKIGPWLYRVAIRQVLLYRRREGRRRHRLTKYVEQNPPQTADETDPLDWMIALETRDQVRSAIAELPPQDREILLLKHTEDWTYQQIADHLGLTFDKVAYRLTRARRRMRTLLTAQSNDGKEDTPPCRSTINESPLPF